MDRAWLFARSPMPSPGSVMVPFNTQIERLRRYCNDHGLIETGFTEVHEYPKTEDLACLIESMKQAKAEVLLFTSLSRLSQDWYEVENFLNECRKKGIAAYSIQEGNLSEFMKTFGPVFREIANQFNAEIDDEEENQESDQEMIQT